MPKIHPRSTACSEKPPYSSCEPNSVQPTTLTVWNKSLIFNCKGFTVYDSKGNLAFRVDNYASNPTTEIILMDATGNDLLLLRRRTRLSLRKQWQGFCDESLVFRITRSSTWWFNNINKKKEEEEKKTLAEVCLDSSKRSEFYVRGSFEERSCAVYDSAGGVVAEVKRKEGCSSPTKCMLETDVFSLVVHPGYDQPMVMGFIITLDRLLNQPNFFRRLLNKL